MNPLVLFLSHIVCIVFSISHHFLLCYKIVFNVSGLQLVGYYSFPSG